MSYPILTTSITSSTLVTLRDRTRQIGEIFGLGKLEITRFVTAVSEIARNAVQFAGSGTAAFIFDISPDKRKPQSILAVITDKGPGFSDIQAALTGRVNAKGHVPIGLVGAQRLVDLLTIETPANGGAKVSITMHLPRGAEPLTAAELNKRMDILAHQKAKSPLEELEKQNRDMLDTLQELREKQLELQHADERKNQFLITLAHELRNPLGTLHMNLEIMRRHPEMTAADFAKRRAAMARQTEQMNKLVEDLVDVSRVTQGKVELVKVPLELNELVVQAIEMCGSAIESKKHQATVQAYEDDLWIEGDAMRLKQVLANLIQNAARYTPAGGHIVVSVGREDSNAILTVSDNGIGIAADLLPQVFDLFVQGEGPVSNTPGGLGIGLTLVKRLVETHGGSVKVVSEGPGMGSRFSIALPLPQTA